MNALILYQATQAIILLIVFLLLSRYFQIRKNAKPLSIRPKRFEQLKDMIHKSVDESEINREFNQSGIPLTAFQYQAYRLAISAVWFSYLLITARINGGQISLQSTFLFILFFVISSPRTKLFNRKSPFKLIMEGIANQHRNKLNLELYRSVSQLKNLAVARANNPPGSDFILEQLRKFTVKTRPIYNRFMSLWNLGRKEEACTYFQSAIQTKEANELANIFLKLDDLHPLEMKNQLELIQEIFKSERETRKTKSDQQRGYLIMTSVVTALLIVFINFIVVVFFIDFLQTMQTI